MTEQDPEEIKTMILAYLTGINEEEFLYGNFNNNQNKDRIKIAVKIMEKYKDNMIFAHVPDPSPSIIKNLFRKYNLQYQVQYFFYDYIFSSPNMLNEYRDLGLNESVLLRLFTTTLKNLAVELNAFVMSATQISYNMDQNKTSSVKGISNIRGSKAVADTADMGCFISAPTQEELKLVENQIQGVMTPNFVIDIYKNRRGRYKDVRIWSYINLSILRRKDLFMTDQNGNIIKDYMLMEPKLDFSPYQQEINEYNQLIPYDKSIVSTNKEDIRDVQKQKTIQEKMRESDHSFIDTNAFKNDEQAKIRLKTKSLSDLL